MIQSQLRQSQPPRRYRAAHDIVRGLRRGRCFGVDVGEEGAVEVECHDDGGAGEELQEELDYWGLDGESQEEGKGCK